MSIEAMKWAFDQPGVCGSEKLVLIGIASHADSEGRNAYPSLATLARYASVDPRTVRRALRSLEAAGYLHCDLNQGGSMRCSDHKRPNLYELRMLDPRTPVSGVGGARASGEGRTQVSGVGGTQVSSESPKESPLEKDPLPPVGGADGFDEVFGIYPRQVGRSKALQVWRALKPDQPTRQRMVEAIQTWSRSQEWLRNDGQFVPRFTRWLTEQRWLDRPGLTQAPGPATHSAQSELELSGPAAVPPPPEVRARIAAILGSTRRGRSIESKVTA